MLKINGVAISEDQYLLNSLTKACKLKNDCFRVRLPIQKGMLRVILNKTHECLATVSNQPYLSLLYRTLFSTAYYGLFRVSELTISEHQIKAVDIHIGMNKKKILFILRSSKTHYKNVPPQMIKIKSCQQNVTKVRKGQEINDNDNDNNINCPYKLL